MACDIKNAFNWAQRIKFALDHPYGIPQFDKAGHKLFMALHKNTYRISDGSNSFEKERNSVWLDFFNRDGFTRILPFSDRSFFYITLPPSECTLPVLVELYVCELKWILDLLDWQ